VDVSAFSILFTIFGLIATVSNAISLFQDNKIFALSRVALNAIMVVLGVLAGKPVLALAWALVTMLSLVILAKIHK